MHHSNSYRFYIHGGLCNGPPLTLGELAASGLTGLGARSRLDADRDITASPLFTQFVDAVESKGFFNIDDEEMTEELYDERFNKVVAKFRSKLAIQAKQRTLEKQQEQKQLDSTRPPPYTTPPRREREEQRQVNTPKQQHQRTPPLYRQNTGISNYVDSDGKSMKLKNSKERSDKSHSRHAENAYYEERDNSVISKVQKQQNNESPYYANNEKSMSKPRTQYVKSNHYETREESRDDSISYGVGTSKNRYNLSKEWDDDNGRDIICKSYSESDFSVRHNSDTSRNARLAKSKIPSSKVSSNSLSRSLSMDYDRSKKSRSKNGSRSATPTPRSKEKQTDSKTRHRSDYGHKPGGSISTASEADNRGRSSKFDDLVNVNEDDQSILEIDRAEQLKKNGNKYMQNRDYQSAVEAYTAALLVNPVGPNSHVYFSNRAAAYLSLKKFNDAISDSKRSLALKPNYGKAHSRLGLAYFLLGEYEEAVEAYTGAVTHEPNNAAAQSYLEKAMKKLEQEADKGKRKIDQDRRIRKAESKHKTPPPKGSRSSSRVKERSDSRARSLRKFDDEVSTVGSLSNRSFFTSEERTIHLRAEKYKIEGNTYMSAHKYEAAVRSYSNALLESSDGIHSHLYYSNRSAALCYLECFDDAEQDALASIELQPRYAKAHARLGLSRYSQGNYIGAIAAYKDSLRYEADNEAAQTYLEKSKAKLVKQQMRAEGRR